MSFELDDEYKALFARARELAVSVEDNAAAADKRLDVDPIMLEAMKASGLAGLMVPTEFGGSVEKVDSLAVTVVREALNYTSAHLDTLFAMQGIGSFGLTVAGS